MYMQYVNKDMIALYIYLYFLFRNANMSSNNTKFYDITWFVNKLSKFLLQFIISLN